MTEPGPPELIVCDSSFVGAVAQRRTRPQRVAHWDRAVLARIDRARAAISIITLAEARAGYVEGGFGAPRIEREERRLQAYAQLPFDDDVLAEWSRLRPATKAHGLTVGDNDLWIAATAASYGAPLVTCDQDQWRLRDLLPEVLYLPRHSDSAA